MPDRQFVVFKYGKQPVHVAKCPDRIAWFLPSELAKLFEFKGCNELKRLFGRDYGTDGGYYIKNGKAVQTISFTALREMCIMSRRRDRHDVWLWLVNEVLPALGVDWLTERASFRR